MYNSDNLNDMIAVLEQYKYEYTKYYHANGCCVINSTLLLNQLKLNEQEIRAKTIDEFAERMSLEISESIIGGMIFDNRDNSSYDTADKIVDYVIDTTKKIEKQMKGGAE